VDSPTVAAEAQAEERVEASQLVLSLPPSITPVLDHDQWREAVDRWLAGRTSRQTKMLRQTVSALEPLLLGEDPSEQLRALLGFREVIYHAPNVRRGAVRPAALERFVKLAQLDILASGSGDAQAADAAGGATGPLLDVALQALAAVWTLSAGHIGDDVGVRQLKGRQGHAAPAMDALTRTAMRRELVNFDAVPALVAIVAQYAPHVTALSDKKNDKSGWGDTMGFLGARMRKKKPRPKQNTKRGRKLHVEVISASHLASADAKAAKRGALHKSNVHKSDPFCVIKWDDQKVGQTSVVWDANDPVWENEVFVLQLPIKEADMIGHKVKIEVHDMDDGGTGEFLGCTTISGVELAKLPSWGHDSHEVAHVNYKLGPREGTLPSASENRFVQGKIQLGLTVISEDTESGPPKKLEFEILAARGLANADRGKGKEAMSDPYVVAYWNDHKVHTTKVIDNSKNPVWRNERFAVKPLPPNLDHCSLRVEVHDYDGPGKLGEFLGMLEWNGNDEILSAATDVKQDLKLCKKPTDEAHRGDNLLNAFVAGHLAVRIRTVALNQLGGIQMPEYQTSDNLSACVPVRITVVGATKLGKADGKKGGKADSFCHVRLDGAVIGRTKTIRNELSPTWEESFIVCLKPPCLYVPGDGGAVLIDQEEADRHCLHLEVQNEDTATAAGECLGELLLSGSEILKYCIEGGKENKFCRVEKKLGKKPGAGKQKHIKGSLAIEFERLSWYDDFASLAKKPSDKASPTASPWQRVPVPLKIHVIGAADLAQADAGTSHESKSDPFCVVYWNGAQVGRTAVLDNNHYPEWDDEQFIVPVQRPGTSATGEQSGDGSGLRVEVRDFDFSGDHDLLGQVVLKGTALQALPFDRKLDYDLAAETKKVEDMLLATPEAVTGTVSSSVVDGVAASQVATKTPDPDPPFVVKGFLSLRFNLDGKREKKTPASMKDRAAKWAASAKRNVEEGTQGISFDQVQSDLMGKPPAAKRLLALTYALGALSSFALDNKSTVRTDTHVAPWTHAQMVVRAVCAHRGLGVRALLSLMRFESDDDSERHADLASNVLMACFGCDEPVCDSIELDEIVPLASCVDAQVIEVLTVLTASRSRHVCRAALCILVQVFKRPECRAALVLQDAGEPTRCAEAVLQCCLKLGLASFERLKSVRVHSVRGHTAGVGEHGHKKGRHLSSPNSETRGTELKVDEFTLYSLQCVAAIIWGCLDCIARSNAKLAAAAEQCPQEPFLNLDKATEQKLSMLLENLLTHEVSGSDDAITTAGAAALSCAARWSPRLQSTEDFITAAKNSYLHVVLLERIDTRRRAAPNLSVLDAVNVLLRSSGAPGSRKDEAQPDSSVEPGAAAAAAAAAVVAAAAAAAAASDTETKDDADSEADGTDEAPVDEAPPLVDNVGGAVGDTAYELVKCGAYEILLSVILRDEPSAQAVQAQVLLCREDSGSSKNRQAAATTSGVADNELGKDSARAKRLGTKIARSAHRHLRLAAARTMYFLAEAEASTLQDDQDSPGTEQRVRVDAIIIRSVLLLLPGAPNSLLQVLSLTLWWWAHNPEIRKCIWEAAGVQVLTVEMRRGRVRSARSLSCLLGAVFLLLRHEPSASVFASPFECFEALSPQDVAREITRRDGSGASQDGEEESTCTQADFNKKIAKVATPAIGRSNLAKPLHQRGTGGVVSLAILVASYLPACRETAVESDFMKTGSSAKEVADFTELVELSLTLLLQLTDLNNPELHAATCKALCGIDILDVPVPSGTTAAAVDAEEDRDADASFAAESEVLPEINPIAKDAAVLVLIRAALDHAVPPQVRRLAAAVILKVCLFRDGRTRIIEIVASATSAPRELKAWRVAVDAAEQTTDATRKKRLLEGFSDAQHQMYKREYGYTSYNRLLRCCFDGEEAAAARADAAEVAAEMDEVENLADFSPHIPAAWQPESDGLGLLPSLWSRQKRLEAAAEQRDSMLRQPHATLSEIPDVRRTQRQAKVAALPEGGAEETSQENNSDLGQWKISPERANLRNGVVKLIEERQATPSAALVSAKTFCLSPAPRSFAAAAGTDNRIVFLRAPILQASSAYEFCSGRRSSVEMLATHHEIPDHLGDDAGASGAAEGPDSSSAAGAVAVSLISRSIGDRFYPEVSVGTVAHLALIRPCCNY